jgi:hypothetical protein
MRIRWPPRRPMNDKAVGYMKVETHFMRLLRSKCFYLLIAVITLSAYSYGQRTTGALVGTVYDESAR